MSFVILDPQPEDTDLITAEDEEGNVWVLAIKKSDLDKLSQPTAVGQVIDEATTE